MISFARRFVASKQPLTALGQEGLKPRPTFKKNDVLKNLTLNQVLERV